MPSFVSPEAAALRTVNLVSDMLAYWGADERCRFANAAYADWFGRGPDEMRGISLAELLGPLYDQNLPFIRGALAGSVHKVAWSGAALPSVTTAVFPGSSVRGLDHWVPRDAGPDADLLTYVLKNGSNIDALNGINVGTGAGAFQMGFYDGKTFDAGFWGVSMLNFSESGNEMLAWVSHDIASDALERWRTASYQTGVAISLAQPRGITRTESGEFWVVDAATKKVFHLDATGATLGSFSTPGNDPAGLSYDPGP